MSYTTKELKYIKMEVDYYKILRKDILSFDFVVNYVLKDPNITIDMVYSYQPHLIKKLEEFYGYKYIP